MQYMGSASQKLWQFTCGTMILSYVFVLIYEYYAFDNDNIKNIIRQHSRNLAISHQIDKVIVGGSNAIYSLSAEMLSKHTGENWYNLALPNEGFSDQAYTLFLGNALSKNKRNLITKVVYSTILPYRFGSIAQRGQYIAISGDNRFMVKPDRSLWSYIRQIVTGGRRNATPLTMPTVYGDFDFSGFTCRAPSQKDIAYQNEIIAVAANWLSRRVADLADLYVNAEIVVVLPAEFYGPGFDVQDRKIFGQSLFGQVELMLEGQSFGRQVIYVAQPPFPHIGYICDARHHANDKGRRWRTSDLVNRMHPGALSEIAKSCCRGHSGNNEEMLNLPWFSGEIFTLCCPDDLGPDRRLTTCHRVPSSGISDSIDVSPSGFITGRQ